MVTDPDAQSITINYTGGSITMPVGNAKSLFGSDYNDVVGDPVQIVQDVSGHARVRVIGEPSVNVASHTRTFTQWPTSQANNAAAGKEIYISWEGSAGEWSARVTGAMADLGDFLLNSAPQLTVFRTSRGTKYGPFIKDSSD